MLRLLPALALLVSLGASGMFAHAQEKLDYTALVKIQDEGLNRSQVMDHAWWLSDVYGPRLTGSPGIRQAGDWAVKKLREWGLSNARQEAWTFGKGWSLVRFSAHLVEPQIQPLIGFPKAWTPGTNGLVTADVVQVSIHSEADFDQYRGKLAGKVVLTQPARDVPRVSIGSTCSGVGSGGWTTRCRFQRPDEAGGDAQSVDGGAGDPTAGRTRSTCSCSPREWSPPSIAAATRRPSRWAAWRAWPQ